MNLSILHKYILNILDYKSILSVMLILSSIILFYNSIGYLLLSEYTNGLVNIVGGICTSITSTRLISSANMVSA